MATDLTRLNDPWLVTVWPGMGSVAVLAGSHLAAALGADIAMELPATEFFDVQHVDVRDGLASTGKPPRNVFLLWRDPEQRRDLVIFIAESQPSHNGIGLCRRIAEHARRWHVQRITTFAAMGTQLHPASRAGVFAVATNRDLADECRQHDAELLKQGQVSGMNGLMLAAAAELEIPAVCLMGEMPYFAVNVPNPPAALAALQAFTALAGLEIDLRRLETQAEQVRAQLERLIERLSAEQDPSEGDDLGFTTPNLTWDQQTAEDEKAEEPQLSPETRQRIESLFEQVAQDRSKAVRLKQELDRHGVFDEYEDRFLDLFREGG